MKARHSQWLCVMAIGLACGSFACGDDDTTPPTDAGTDAGGGTGGGAAKSGSGSAGKSGSGGAGKSGSGGAGKSGSGGAGKSGSGGAGKGGSGGNGGHGGAGHGGAGGAPGSITCGSNTCTVNTTLLMLNSSAVACCIDDACGQYNIAAVCLPKDAPGPADTSCENLTVPVVVNGVPVMVNGEVRTQTLPGCCATGNECGVSFAQVGWGCVARGDVAADMGGPLSSYACGGEPDGGTSDAGL